jgi:phage baseplate assembly protein W
MRGLDANTGKPLEGFAHLVQSIRDILTTPIGTRVMRRDYGSRLFQLIDAPLNARTVLEIYAATVEALIRWEPRISVQRVSTTQVQPGSITLTLEALDVSTGELVLVDGIIV